MPELLLLLFFVVNNLELSNVFLHFIYMLVGIGQSLNGNKSKSYIVIIFTYIEQYWWFKSSKKCIHGKYKTRHRVVFFFQRCDDDRSRSHLGKSKKLWCLAPQTLSFYIWEHSVYSWSSATWNWICGENSALRKLQPRADEAFCLVLFVTCSLQNAKCHEC